jgi:hypothetical protein
MKIKINWLLSFLNLIFFLAMTFFYFNEEKMSNSEKLTAPLRLDYKEKTFSLLPKGSSIYFQKAFPEGFLVYKVYVDIDDDSLKLETLNDPTEVHPIWAEPFLKDELLSLLKNYPLQKDDLRAILSSGYLSKEEIREVLEEFKSWSGSV